MHHHKPECCVTILDCCLQGQQGDSEGSNPQGIFVLTILNHLMKLGMVMHHHDPECYAKRFGCYLQCQGHNAGSNSKITVSSISLADLITHTICPDFVLSINQNTRININIIMDLV